MTPPPRTLPLVAGRSPNESEFREHPVWVQYVEPGDFEFIARWGVDLDQAKRDIFALLDVNEQNIFFPVLELDPPMGGPLYVYAQFTTAAGQSLTGHLVGSHAFAIFCNEQEYIFNLNLPHWASATAAELSLAIGAPGDTPLFPLKYTTGLRMDGKEIAGTIERFWR